jgi:hypothetical protein
METHTEPRAAETGLDGWLVPERATAESPTASDAGLEGTKRPRVIAAAVGLLAVGALAGALGTSALHGSKSITVGTVTNSGTSGNGTPPSGLGGPPGA